MDPSVRMSERNANYDYDTLSDILMRLDPDSLFKSILVSKDWLSVITDPVFRTNYLIKWKDLISSQVVGVLLSDVKGGYRRSPGNQLLATSNFGRYINARNLLPDFGLGFYSAKSSKGGLLLFGGITWKPLKLYVCKPSSGSPPVELPPPPNRISHYSQTCLTLILCDDDEGKDYKVILGSSRWPRSPPVCKNIVSIQTFCSKTWKWEQHQPSKLKYCSSLHMIHRSGGCIMSSARVVYWRAREHNRDCLVASTNGKLVTAIPDPPLIHNNGAYAVTYGLSSHGSVIAATSSLEKYSEWEKERYTINIWCLDEGRREWDSLYSVRQASVWTDNLPLLTSLFKARPKNGFVFLSFVSGKPDTVLLALQRKLFVYHFHTGKLEHMEYLKYGGLGFEFSPFLNAYDPQVTYHPLTLQDLGFWPSSCLSPGSCRSRAKALEGF